MNGFANSFRTFCHISEYGIKGYHRLGSMMAGSSPLVLWAPSSAMLLSDECDMSVHEFLEYVEVGHIVIHARSEWIFDRSFRDSHRWPGASWNSKVDDAIRSICLNDEVVRDPMQRRVVVSPDELGLRFAQDYVGREPEYATRVAQLLNDPKVDRHIPGGTLEMARRNLNLEDQVVTVLRAAFNHGQAMSYSGAAAPIFLESQDAEFLRMLARFDPAEDLSAPSSGIMEGFPATSGLDGSIQSQLVEILHYLHSSNRSSSLRKFMASEGHELLVRWISTLSKGLAHSSPSQLDAVVKSALIREIANGGMSKVRSKLGSTQREASAVMGLASDVAQSIFEPSLGNLVRLAISGYPAGKAVLKRLGWVHSEYHGNQWPYLYVFGARATKRRRGRLLKTLGDE